MANQLSYHYQLVVMGILAGWIGAGGLLCSHATAPLAHQTPSAEDSKTSAAKRSRGAKKPAKPEPARPDARVRADAPLWPQLTEAQPEEALQRQREFLEQLAAKLDRPGLWFVETEFFFLCSVLPSQIAGVAVPNNNAVARRQKLAIDRLRKTRSLARFFHVPEFSDWHYGVASSMTGFLLHANRPAFRELIDGIKSGMSWEKSLHDSYGLTPEELALRYGLQFGIRGVRP